MYSRTFKFSLFDTEKEIVEFVNEKREREAVTVLYNGTGYVLFYYENIPYYAVSESIQETDDPNWNFWD